MKKRKSNEELFSVLDSPEKLWALGWMYSDGCITNNRVTISINKKDLDGIKKLKEIFSYEGNIIECKNNTAGIHITSPKLIKDLINIGCTERKSLTLTFPKSVDWVNMRHFIRGYFDGDGCVTMNSKRNYIRINMKGTYELLKEVKTNVKDCLGGQLRVI